MSITRPLHGRRENVRYQGSSSSDRQTMYSSIPGVHLLGWILVVTADARWRLGLRWDAVVAHVFLSYLNKVHLCSSSFLARSLNWKCPWYSLDLRQITPPMVTDTQLSGHIWTNYADSWIYDESHQSTSSPGVTNPWNMIISSGSSCPQSFQRVFESSFSVSPTIP